MEMELTLLFMPAILPTTPILDQMWMERSTCTWPEYLLENILKGTKDQLLQQQKVLATPWNCMIVQLIT